MLFPIRIGIIRHDSGVRWRVEYGSSSRASEKALPSMAAIVSVSRPKNFFYFVVRLMEYLCVPLFSCCAAAAAPGPLYIPLCLPPSCIEELLIIRELDEFLHCCNGEYNSSLFVSGGGGLLSWVMHLREQQREKSPSSYSPGGWLALSYTKGYIYFPQSLPSPSALFIIISFIFCFHNNEEMRERLLDAAAAAAAIGKGGKT